MLMRSEIKIINLFNYLMSQVKKKIGFDHRANVELHRNQEEHQDL